jgi:hypothetical protein
MTDIIDKNSLIQLKGVFVLYLIVSCNFLAKLFSCKTQLLLESNMYVKHLIGFFTLFFFIIFTQSIDTKDEYIFFKKIYAAVVLYLIFLASTKTKGLYLYLFIFLIGSSFILTSYIDTLDKTKFKERIKKIDNIINIFYRLSIIILILGVISYTIEKKKEYKNNWDTFKFIFGTTSCKNDP